MIQKNNFWILFIFKGGFLMEEGNELALELGNAENLRNYEEEGEE